MGETEGPPKCLAEVDNQLLAPQWHIQGEVRSRRDCGLGVLHVSPPWVEGPVPDHIGVVSSQGEQEWHGRHSRLAYVRHWVACGWEASRMVGRNACSKLAQNRGHPYFLTLRDVSSIGACKPRIFFINGFLCFLRYDCSRMEKEKD